MQLNVPNLDTVSLDCLMKPLDEPLLEITDSFREEVKRHIGQSVKSISGEQIATYGEQLLSAVVVRGVMTTILYLPERIEARAGDISSMLDQLPKTFRESTGGMGDSFSNARFNEDGEQWGEHLDVDHLLCLGMGAGIVQLLTPDRDDWSILPGGLPYFVVKCID